MDIYDNPDPASMEFPISCAKQNGWAEGLHTTSVYGIISDFTVFLTCSHWK